METPEPFVIEYSTDLRQRLTHKYVGTCRDLDEWEPIGALTILSTVTLPVEDDDICEPRTQRHMIVVDEAAESKGDEMVTKALHAEFTQAGCSHDYDCCGCRSYSTGRVQKLTGRLWCVEVHSSRNY